MQNADAQYLKGISTYVHETLFTITGSTEINTVGCVVVLTNYSRGQGYTEDVRRCAGGHFSHIPFRALYPESTYGLPHPTFSVPHLFPSEE